jgi:adenosylhomocysteinase
VLTVAGYGWCGRGIAMRALEAVMDGYRVMPLVKAAEISDFIVTATGDKNVVGAAHL